MNASGQKLPKIWLPSMKIESSYGGGMLYYNYKIIITDSVSSMKIESNEGIENYSRKFTKAELNALLAFFGKHRFDKITSKLVGPAHDKASESVSVSWENDFIGASESASQNITEEYSEDFRAIQEHLQGLFKKDN